MKKFVVALLTFFLLAVSSISSQAASPNQPVTFDNIWRGQQNNVIEQQSDQHWPPDPLRYNPDWLHYVVNPFSDCIWNDDDNADIIKVGLYLNPNTTARGAYCKVFDSHSAYVCINNNCQSWSFAKAEGIGFSVVSKSPDLIVQMVWQPQNKTITLTPVYDKVNKNYLYRICAIAYYNNGDPALQYVPGSNGSNDPNSVEGVGVVSTFIPTITNPTGRVIRDIAYTLEAFGASQLGSGSCYDDAPLQTHQGTETIYKEYPFAWYN